MTAPARPSSEPPQEAAPAGPEPGTTARHYGGQAVIEGVMIRGSRHVCVACREPVTSPDGKPALSPDGELFVQAELIETFAGRLARRYRAARWPFLRGTLVLLESVEMGSKGLRLSAAVALRPTGGPEAPLSAAAVSPALETSSGEVGTAHIAPVAPIAPVLQQQSREPAAHRSARPTLTVAFIVLLLSAVDIAFRWGQLDVRNAWIAAGVGTGVILGISLLAGRARQEEIPTGTRMGEIAVGATMALGLSLGIGLFFLLPSLIAGAFQSVLRTPWEKNLLEGAIRIVMFFGYLAAISRMENIHRLFQYHGAEHQVIHVHENKLPLTPENAAQFPTVHPRCGTAFLAIVLVISVVVYTFVGWQVWWQRLLLRVVLLPVVAGISYELLKWNSARPNPVLKLLVAPGLWFQRITTQPPTLDQVEVAIAAMRGVLAAEGAPVENLAPDSALPIEGVLAAAGAPVGP